MLYQDCSVSFTAWQLLAKCGLKGKPFTCHRQHHYLETLQLATRLTKSAASFMDSTIVYNTARWRQYNMVNSLQNHTIPTLQITREAEIWGHFCECKVQSKFYVRQFIMAFNKMLCCKIMIHLTHQGFLMHTCHGNVSQLVKVMACHLFGTCLEIIWTNAALWQGKNFSNICYPNTVNFSQVNTFETRKF